MGSMIEFKIIATTDRSQQATYQHIGRELSFGKSEGDMIIDDPQLSPLQVRIRHDGNAFVLENVGEGEVKLNGRLVQGPTPIKERDTLLIGRTTINFFRMDLNPPLIPEPYQPPHITTRFAEGTKEKAILDALEFLTKKEEATRAPAPPPAPGKPPLPPGVSPPPVPPRKG